MSNSIDMSADMTKCPPGGDYNQLLLHRTPFFCSECVALLRHGGGGGGTAWGCRYQAHKRCLHLLGDRMT